MSAEETRTVSVYARLSPAAVYRTVDHGGAIVDYAEDGTPVGVEVLNAVGVTIDGDPLAFAWEEPCDNCDHARRFHADEVGDCSVEECFCTEWWAQR